jgi:hypothetical protein
MLTLTALGVLLILITELLINVLLHLFTCRVPCDLGSLHTASREPQEVICLELVDLVEEHVKPAVSC